MDSGPRASRDDGDFPSVDKLGMAVDSQRVGRRGEWNELRPGDICVIKETLIVVLEGGA